MEKLVAIDLETTPKDSITKDIDKIWCICMAWRDDKKEIVTQSIIFPDGITKEELTLKRDEGLESLQQILDNDVEVVPVFHNALFEYKHLTESGFRIKNFHDTQVMGYVLCPSLLRFSLEAWGERGYCDVKTFADVDINEFFGTFSLEIVERCKADVTSTLQLAEKLLPELRQDLKAYDLYQNLDIPFIPILNDLNNNGIHIDSEELTNFTLGVEAKLEVATNAIWDLVPTAPGKKSHRLTEVAPSKLATNAKLTKQDIGKFVYCGETYKLDKNIGIERPFKVYRKVEKFNPGSQDQKTWALYTYDKYIAKETSDKTGKPKTDKWALEKAAVAGSDVANLIIDYQELNKLYTTYCIPLQNKRDDKSRIYSEFTNTVTLTGRLSSRTPNFQNIPKRSDLGKEIRKCITAPNEDTVIIDIDLSAAELRILAWYLVKVFGDNEKYPDAWLFWNAFQRGEDPHANRMELFDCNRGESKTLTFGTMYGMGSVKFARTLRCNSERANYLLNIQKKKMPSINALKDWLWDTARSRPDYTIHSLYGRRFTYPDLVSRNSHKRAHAERQIFNALIQGTQGDIMKILMMEAYPFIREVGAKMIMQIHDQLVVECPIGGSEWLAEKLGKVFTRMDLLPGLPLVGEAKIGGSLGTTE